MEQASANLRTVLRDLALKFELPALWRWWLGELAPLVPTAPRAAVQRRRIRPVLAFGTDTAVLWEPRIENGGLVLSEAATIPLTGDAAAVAHAGRAAIETLPARALPSGSSAVKVVVALPPTQVLRKKLILPAAIEENLVEALAFDLDRHTPFRPDQLYFDAIVIARDMAKKEIRVDWAAALKTAVDHARRQAESWGATVVGITPESLPAGAGTISVPAASKLNLLPLEDRPYATSWRRWQFWVPVGAIVLLVLASVALPLWQKREYAIELAHVTEQARVQAGAADAWRQLLDSATGDYNFALGKKYAYPSTLQLLDDVTRLLPDDTWLTQFEIKNLPKAKEPHRELLLRGETANAGKLISALEDSKQFEQTAPRSPTTKIQPGPGEVFDIGSQVIPLQPPTMVALVNPTPRPPGAGSESSGASGPGASRPGATAARTPVTPAPSAATKPAGDDSDHDGGRTATAPPPRATPPARPAQVDAKGAPASVDDDGGEALAAARAAKARAAEKDAAMQALREKAKQAAASAPAGRPPPPLYTPIPPRYPNGNPPHPDDVSPSSGEE